MMGRLTHFFLILTLLTLASCASIGTFETAHTLDKGQHDFDSMGGWGVQRNSSQTYDLDSTSVTAVKMGFRLGLADGVEYSLHTDIIFTYTLNLKFRLTPAWRDHAFALGPVVSATPFASVLLSGSHSVDDRINIFANYGLAAYYSYYNNDLTVFANTHALKYTKKGIFLHSTNQSLLYGFGVNAGMLYDISDGKMSLGFQLSVERMGEYMELMGFLGALYHFTN